MDVELVVFHESAVRLSMYTKLLDPHEVQVDNMDQVQLYIVCFISNDIGDIMQEKNNRCVYFDKLLAI